MSKNEKNAKDKKATTRGANAIKQITHSEWDLSVLFSNESKLNSFVSKQKKAAEAFAKSFQNKLHTLDSASFNNAIIEYESILEGLGRIGTFAFLHFAKDTSKGDFYAKYEMMINEIHKSLLFFEIEFANLDSKIQADFMEKAIKYKYYLSRILAKTKHQLSLPEEKVLLATSPVGVEAFSRLFDEHLAGLRFKDIAESKSTQDNLDSKSKKDKKAFVGEEEMLSYLHHSKRSVRKAAQKTFTKGLKKSRHLLSFVLNMVRKDLSISVNLRNYEKPESFRHISNNATQKSVDKLVSIVSDNFPMVAEYYHIKKKLLGLKTLKDYDRYAPIDKSNMQIPYGEGLSLVLDSFHSFSPVFSSIAKKAIAKGWVDSALLPNKRGGAFSHGCVPSAHPFVLLNYTQSRRDIFTIAHEFGHMIHQELSKTQGYLNMDTPLTTAETASVFAEMLLFDKLKGTLPKNELISLYAGKIEDIFSTLFRQIVMTNFERRIHAQKEELKPEIFDQIWHEENEKMFGDSLKLSKNYDSWWCYIPHFIHSPFYCYAYSYGQLLVLALFGLYKSKTTPKAREKFISTYIEFLSLGGSLSPKDLVAKFGLNIESDRFWQIGIDEVRKMLDEFKELL